MTEDQLEQEVLGRLSEVGYAHIYGPDITPYHLTECHEALLLFLNNNQIYKEKHHA